ncbi:MAG: helix-turn-helix domain-containing protein [Thermomicrobiales bacterium]
MAGKKSKSEIEAIRSELTELTEAIYALREQVRMESAAVAAATGIDSSVADGVEALPAGESLGEGEIVLRGSVRLPAAGTGGSDLAIAWSSEGLDASRLAGQASDDLAKVLAAIGHRQRLAILLAVLGGPKSAADLVATLELGTTGAAYHHLNVLSGAGLVTQVERGIFSIAPDRVAMLLTILASPLVRASATEIEDLVPDATEAPKSKRSRKAA